MTGEGQRVNTSRESAFRCTAHWGASPPGVICAGWGKGGGRIARINAAIRLARSPRRRLDSARICSGDYGRQGFSRNFR